MLLFFLLLIPAYEAGILYPMGFIYVYDLWLYELRSFSAKATR